MCYPYTHWSNIKCPVASSLKETVRPYTHSIRSHSLCRATLLLPYHIFNGSLQWLPVEDVSFWVEWQRLSQESSAVLILDCESVVSATTAKGYSLSLQLVTAQIIVLHMVSGDNTEHRHPHGIQWQHRLWASICPSVEVSTLWSSPTTQTRDINMASGCIIDHKHQHCPWLQHRVGHHHGLGY